MKFLCMRCDAQMTLVETIPAAPDGGISVVFACPVCSNRIGMLANPWETQVVNSLGVRIGGGTAEAESPAASGDALAKCPFGEVVRQMVGPERESEAGTVWSPEAFARLQGIPESVRPMAKQGVEDYARSRGYRRIDEDVLAKAREAFGM